MKLYLIILLVLSGLCNLVNIDAAEKIIIHNDTDHGIYITTAYYRPFLKRIDTDFPVVDVQYLSSKASKIFNRLERKNILTGNLVKYQILIAASDESSIKFINSIIAQQHKVQEVKNSIEEGKKGISFIAKLNDRELKNLKEALKKEAKILTTLEELSEENLKAVSVFKINDDKVYNIKEDAQKLQLVREQSMTASGFVKKEKKTIVHVENSNASLGNGKVPHLPINEKEKNQEQEENTPEVKQDQKQEEQKQEEKQLFPPLLLQSDELEKAEELESPTVDGDGSFIANTWESMARFDASQLSIINGTKNELMVAIVYWDSGKGMPIPKGNDIFTIESNGSYTLKSPAIQFLKWRYLFYKDREDKNWSYTSMWPIANVYIFDENKKVITYNYAAKGAVITKDIGVQEAIYVAVYHYTKGKGALRVTPVIEIAKSENPIEVPYFSTFTQFGYRQLAVHKNRSSLAAYIDEAGYKSIITKNIQLTLKQPYYYVIEVEKSLAIYDDSEWNRILKGLNAPKDPIKLSWLDEIVKSKLVMGIQALQEKLEN